MPSSTPLNSPSPAETDQWSAFDMMLCCGIVFVVMALLLAQVSVLTAKARLAELFTGSTPHRIDLVLAAAQTGNFGVAEGTGEAGQMRVVAAKQHGQAKSPQEALSPQDALYGNGHGFRYEVRDGRLWMSGSMLSESFQLPFSLAVPAQGPIGNVLWTCGNAPPPAGWIAPEGSQHTRMRSDLLFHMCRAPAGART